LIPPVTNMEKLGLFGRI